MVGKGIRGIYLSCSKSDERKRAAIFQRANRFHQYNLVETYYVEDIERADLVLVVGEKEASMEKEIKLAREKNIPVFEVTEQFVEKKGELMDWMLDGTYDLERGYDYDFER